MHGAKKKGRNFKLNDKSIKVFAGSEVYAQIHRQNLIPSQWLQGLEMTEMFLELF